jgi:hypothetical protein
MSNITILSLIGAVALHGANPPTKTDQDKYVGMWVTADGYIRHELLPNGRYDEARGKQESAYRGRYVLTGDHIDYVDDTGFRVATGELGYQIHRRHRYPGTHPVASGRFFASTVLRWDAHAPSSRAN